jgi:hypothetical protein
MHAVYVPKWVSPIRGELLGVDFFPTGDDSCGPANPTADIRNEKSSDSGKTLTVIYFRVL